MKKEKEKTTNTNIRDMHLLLTSIDTWTASLIFFFIFWTKHVHSLNLDYHREKDSPPKRSTINQTTELNH